MSIDGSETVRLDAGLTVKSECSEATLGKGILVDGLGNVPSFFSGVLMTLWMSVMVATGRTKATAKTRR